MAHISHLSEASSSTHPLPLPLPSPLSSERVHDTYLEGEPGTSSPILSGSWVSAGGGRISRVADIRPNGFAIILRPTFVDSPSPDLSHIFS